MNETDSNSPTAFCEEKQRTYAAGRRAWTAARLAENPQHTHTTDAAEERAPKPQPVVARKPVPDAPVYDEGECIACQ